jgi:hypothetical protein
MGAKPSTMREDINRTVKRNFEIKKADIKQQWNNPKQWEADEKRKREERSKRWWDMYQRDETKDPPPVALGTLRDNIKSAFNEAGGQLKFEFDPILTDTQLAENNRRQNEQGGMNLCVGDACNVRRKGRNGEGDMKISPIVNPNE